MHVSTGKEMCYKCAGTLPVVNDPCKTSDERKKTMLSMNGSNLSGL